MSKGDPVSIRQLPSGRYQARHNSRSLGVYDTYAQALVEGERIRGELQSGKITLDDLNATVAKLIERWLLTKRKLAQSTRDKYVWDLNHYTIPRIGHLPYRHVTDDTLNEFITELQDAGYAGGSIYAACAPLRAAFQWAVDTGRLARNPFANVEIPQPGQRTRFLLPEQVHHLAACAPRDGDTILIMAYQALRIGEMMPRLLSEPVPFTVGQIDFDTLSMLVVGKGRKERRVPLAPPVVPLLKARCVGALPSAPVFRTRSGKALRVSNWRKWVWTPAVERAGVKDVTAHTLRHSGLTWLGNLAGASSVTVRDAAGHTSVTVSDRYLHTIPEAMRAAYGRMDFTPTQETGA